LSRRHEADLLSASLYKTESLETSPERRVGIRKWNVLVLTAKSKILC
jgi:hypothetical protein